MGNYKDYKTIDSWPKKSEYVVFIDENNSDSNYKNIQKKKKNNQEIQIEEKYFTLTGCIISFPEYKLLKKIDEIKELQASSKTKVEKWEIAKEILTFILDKGVDIAIMFIPQILMAIGG